MPNLRVILVLLTIMAMIAAPVVMPSLGAVAPSSSQALAANAAAPVTADDDDDDGDNRDDDDDGDNSGDDNDNGDDDDDGWVAPPPRPAAPTPPPAPSCSTPGQDISFVSGDGRVTVQVFANMGQSVKFSIRQPIDPASVAPAPGPVVGGLLFQLIAETCDGSPLATLPSEVNLGVRYSDADAAGLNEANFSLARLNTTANQWQAAAKQAADPPANYTSATVNEMGYYVLHQRP